MKNQQQKGHFLSLYFFSSSHATSFCCLYKPLTVLDSHFQAKMSGTDKLPRKNLGTQSMKHHMNPGISAHVYSPNQLLQKEGK
jgi:hypothetical protein